MLVWKIFRKCMGPSFSDNYLPNVIMEHTKNADNIFKLRGKLKEVGSTCQLSIQLRIFKIQMHVEIHPDLQSSHNNF